MVDVQFNFEILTPLGDVKTKVYYYLGCDVELKNKIDLMVVRYMPNYADIKSQIKLRNTYSATFKTERYIKDTLSDLISEVRSVADIGKKEEEFFDNLLKGITKPITFFTSIPEIIKSMVRLNYNIIELKTIQDTGFYKLYLRDVATCIIPEVSRLVREYDEGECSFYDAYNNLKPNLNLVPIFLHPLSVFYEYTSILKNQYANYEEAYRIAIERRKSDLEERIEKYRKVKEDENKYIIDDKPVVDRVKNELSRFLEDVRWLGKTYVKLMTDDSLKRITGNDLKLLPAYRVLEEKETESGVVRSDKETGEVFITLKEAKSPIDIILNIKKTLEEIQDPRIKGYGFENKCNALNISIKTNDNEETKEIIKQKKGAIYREAERDSINKFLIQNELSNLGTIVYLANDDTLCQTFSNKTLLNIKILILILVQTTFAVFKEIQKDKAVLEASGMIREKIKEIMLSIGKNEIVKKDRVGKDEFSDVVVSGIEKALEENGVEKEEWEDTYRALMWALIDRACKKLNEEFKEIIKKSGINIY